MGLVYKYSTYDLVKWEFIHTKWWIFIPLVIFDFTAFCIVFTGQNNDDCMVKIGIIF